MTVIPSEESIIFGAGRARGDHWNVLLLKKMQNHATLHFPAFRGDYLFHFSKHQLIELRTAIDKAITHFEGKEHAAYFRSDEHARLCGACIGITECDCRCHKL